jgi:hypothetical protein
MNIITFIIVQKRLVIMTECPKCGGGGWFYACSICGNQISAYFDEANGETYESCSFCDEQDIEYDIIEASCDHCSTSGPTSQNKNYESFFNETISAYKFEFGNRKYEKIQKKITDSNRVVQSLMDLKDYPKPPSVEGILSMLSSIPFFGLGPKRNLVLGGVIFIYMWNYGCNKNNLKLSEEGIINLMEGLFERTSRMM